MLRADEIAVVRGERRIVDGITLVLGIGVTTLEGPSGCGKSTLCRALAKLVPLTAGTLTLDPPAPVYRREQVRVSRSVVLRVEPHDEPFFSFWPPHHHRVPRGKIPS